MAIVASAMVRKLWKHRHKAGWDAKEPLPWLRRRIAEEWAEFDDEIDAGRIHEAADELGDIGNFGGMIILALAKKEET